MESTETRVIIEQIERDANGTFRRCKAISHERIDGDGHRSAELAYHVDAAIGQIVPNNALHAEMIAEIAAVFSEGGGYTGFKNEAVDEAGNRFFDAAFAYLEVIEAWRKSGPIGQPADDTVEG